MAVMLHPRGSNIFYGAIMAMIALLTAGTVVIAKAAKGIVRAPARPQSIRATPISASTRPGMPSPVPASRAAGLPIISPAARRSVDHLVFALVAWCAVDVIRLLLFASRGFGLRGIPPFILSEAPDAILICVMLKRPGRRAFTFLIAILCHPILMILFNPLVRDSYHRSFIYDPMGFGLLVFSDVIFIVILVQAYKAIHQTGFRPRPSSAIFATVGMYFYFYAVAEITTYLYQFRS